MKKIYLIIALVFTVGLWLGFSVNVSGEEALIPSWIKNTAGFWVDGKIGDQEFVQALQYLVEKDILKIPPKKNTIIDQIQSKFPLSNSQIIKELNENHNTFTETNCYVKSTGNTSISGKITIGNYDLHSLDITIEFLNSDGRMITTESTTIYDLYPNETKIFDTIGIGTPSWADCKFHVTDVDQP